MFRETICCLCLWSVSLPTRYRGKVQSFNHSITCSSPLVFPKWQNEVAGKHVFQFTKSSITNQNTQLTEKSVGITIRISPFTQLKNHNTQLTKKSVGITQFIKISYLELWLFPLSMFVCFRFCADLQVQSD